jgi:subtilase-type serine protease
MVVERNQTPMAAFAQTNNQRAVANAIDGQPSGAEPYNDVLLNDNPGQLPGWYQDWSGEIYSANQAALIYNSRLLAQVVNWRLQDSWLDNSLTTRLQQVGQTGQAGQTNTDTTVWAQAYGNWDKFSADANAQKASSNSGGMILGVDHKVSPSLRLGGGFSASSTNTSVAASSAGTSGYHVMLYGTYDRELVRLNGGVVQSWYTASVNRTLPLDDQGNASGTVASRSTQLFADLSSPITISKREDHHTALSPFAQVSQIWLNTSNFGETGAEAGLSGQATNASTGFGTLGARLSHQWQSNQTNWQASVSAGWQRAWGDLSPTTTLAFATGPDFAVSSAAMARDSAVIEVGIGASLDASSRLSLVYSATVAGQSNSQMLQASLQWWF